MAVFFFFFLLSAHIVQEIHDHTMCIVRAGPGVSQYTLIWIHFIHYLLFLMKYTKQQ